MQEIQEMWVWSVDQEDPLEKEIATHSSILLGNYMDGGVCRATYSLKSKSESFSVLSDSLWSHGLYIPWNSPGQNTGVGSLFLLQGIFPTQGSNPRLPHYRRILYQLSHKGSPRILEWVARPFSSDSSPPRNQTGVSCIAGRFFTHWAIREAPHTVHGITKSQRWLRN